MATVKPPAAQRAAQTCVVCSFQNLCLARGLDERQSLRLEALTQHHQHLPNAEARLFWAGDEFQNVYAVRSGCLKTYTVDDEGHEHIRGFHLPGDLIGLDAIFARHYPSNAVAVVPSEVCAIPYAALSRMVSDVPALQRSMMETISRQLCISLALSGDFTAEQRTAAFLLYFYQRMRCRGMNEGNSVQLPMPRRDIAGYLRLAIETVSRVLGRFEREDWIEVSVRHLRLLDMQALWQLAQPVGICEAPELPHRVRMPLRPRSYALREVYA
jgi:CRP/FNR family transcriptional regulator, anaerobic regulatory protein